MSESRVSAWRQAAPLPDEIRCDALLWYARFPDRYRGDVRCRQLATCQIEGTDVIVCDLHAAPLRFGQTVETVHGTVTGASLQRLETPAGTRKLKSARVDEADKPPHYLVPLPDVGEIPSASYANSTRDAFPDALPPRPLSLDDRRWQVLQRRWDGATLADIAKELNVSRERAHQLERSAIGAILSLAAEDQSKIAAEG